MSVFVFFFSGGGVQGVYIEDTSNLLSGKSKIPIDNSLGLGRKEPSASSV